MALLRARIHATCIPRRGEADSWGPEAPGRLWGSHLWTGLKSATKVIKRGAKRDIDPESDTTVEHMSLGRAFAARIGPRHIFD